MKLTAGLPALLLVAAACPSYTPPQTHAVPAQYIVHADFNATWTEIIAFFAESKVPIQTIDKSSGLISSKGFESAEFWLDCGTITDGLMTQTTNNGRLADFNVFVRDLGRDSTSVRINFSGYEVITTMVAGANGPTTSRRSCTTTGEFEKALAGHITAAAQGKGAK